MFSEITFIEELKHEFYRRVVEEGIHRILICLSLLSQDQVWQQPNHNLNSIGNLILHLEGNVKQWFLSSFSLNPDTRIRSSEFDPSRRESISNLTSRLHSLAAEIQTLLKSLSEDDLLKKYNVQCYSESGISIIIHVIEHFSYHVGQISFYTKLLVDQDLGYYADEPLDQTN
jgi:uncharacterized damage-inducible protein DinB